MSDAMTIMTHRNEIANQSIFSIAINMMNDKHSFIGNIAVVTLLIKHFPGVLPIATRHLFIKRLTVPISNATRLTAISATTRPCKFIRNNIKSFITSQTNTFDLIRSRFRTANTRTKILRFSWMLFRNKLFCAISACVGNNRLFSKDATTFMTACNMARFMTFVYTKLNRANRTNFNYFIHGGILS